MSNHPINESLAKQAKEAMSFDSYKPGSATAEYNAACAKAKEIARTRIPFLTPIPED